jgi:hypothetical protein
MIKNDIIDLINLDDYITKNIKGKRVCICGPAKSNEGKNLGKLIDNYDLVCRINFRLPFNQKNDYGEKCDIIFTGLHRILVKSVRDDLIKYNEKKSKYYNLMKNTNYIYFVNQVNDTKFRNKPYKHSDISPDDSWRIFQKKFNNDKIKYGVINFNIIDKCKNYINKNFNTIDSNSPITNSGLHAILILLKHEPKELFITGFNFFNWGNGAVSKNLYHSEVIDNYKKNNNKNNGHVVDETMIFFKQLLKEYDCIKLDNILKLHFNII